MKQGALALILAVFVLAGCRTYGDYGSEEATYQQIQEAQESFEQELVRARADLSTLQRAAAGNEILGQMAAQYAYLVQGHESILEVHAERIADLSADSDYRTLHRTFGGMISEQNTIRTQYEGLLTNVYKAYMPPDTTSLVERPYALIPPYYERVRESARNLTLNEVLAEVQSGRMPAAGFQLAAPPARTTEQSGHGETESQGQH